MVVDPDVWFKVTFPRDSFVLLFIVNEMGSARRLAGISTTESRIARRWKRLRDWTRFIPFIIEVCTAHHLL